MVRKRYEERNDRTRNKMLKTKTEMESLVTEFNGYYGIKCSIKLVGAAVIISS